MRNCGFLVIPILLILSGCTTQSDVEKSIRDEMKSRLGVNITTIELKKQDDGGYLGTATAENGDVYDVTTLPRKDNKIEWKALPGQAMVEKMVHAGLEQQLSAKVKSLQLTKHGPGNFTGPAELSTGAKVMVSTRVEGMQLLWEAKAVNP